MLCYQAALFVASLVRSETERLRNPSELEQRCPVSLDLVLLLHNTIEHNSAGWRNIVDRIEESLEAIKEVYIEPRFALSIFEDIPVIPLGKPGDVCYENVFQFDDDVGDFMVALDAVPEGNQNDEPDSQYIALLSAALDTAFGWRGEVIPGGENDGTQIAKIILTITEGTPHVSGDGLKWDLVTPPSPPTFPYQCGTWDYPGFASVKDTLLDRKAIPAFTTKTNPEEGIYQEFIDTVMDGRGVVTSRAAMVQIQDEFVLAIDGALEIWCEDYYTPEDLTTEDTTPPTTTPPTAPEDTTPPTTTPPTTTPPTVPEDTTPPTEPEDTTPGPPVIPGTTPGPPAIPEICEQKDIIFVRDLTSSTFEHIANMRKYVGNFVDASPEGSQFALVSHSDKPVEPFGCQISMDYCFWVHSDLANKVDFMVAYEDTDSDHRSGGDFPENQLDAVIKGAREISLTQEDAKCNCIVILSDSFYHEAGDFEDMPTYNPDGDECENEDYPSIQQVADQLVANNVGCFTIATVNAVVPFWEDFRMDMMYAGYGGTIEIEVIPDPARRTLSSFASQERIDLRHLQSRSRK